MHIWEITIRHINHMRCLYLCNLYRICICYITFTFDSVLLCTIIIKYGLESFKIKTHHFHSISFILMKPICNVTTQTSKNYKNINNFKRIFFLFFSIFQTVINTYILYVIVYDRRNWLLFILFIFEFESFGFLIFLLYISLNLTACGVSFISLRAKLKLVHLVIVHIEYFHCVRVVFFLFNSTTSFLLFRFDSLFVKYKEDFSGNMPTRVY